mmetsp:Transcript_23514/g.34828  ORF Transcript_23514/g.34828 Transcript_23514/m.34828 type:complete len:90 (-) Transcript_23514:123-392(-)
MSRIDGKKIVGVALAGIAGAIGLGQIYLPYIADKDKLRGMFEEEDMPDTAKKEMDMMMKAEIAAAEARQQSQGKSGAGSMWSNLRRKGE